MRTFDLSEAVEEVVELCTPVALGRGMEPIILLDSDLPDGVRAFFDDITETLGSLLAHALRFGGGGDLVIRAGCDAGAGDRGEVEMSVSYPGARNAPVEGSSALSAARKLAARFGGRVAIESQAERSTLHLTLPSAESRPRAGGARREPAPRVLVYDPHPLSQRSIRNRLLALGADVRVSRTLGQMSGALAEGIFDLAVAGFSAVQVGSGEMERVLRGLRTGYAGPLLAMASTVPLQSPASLAHDPGIHWLAKPGRRSALARVLADVAARPARRPASGRPRRQAAPRRASPLRDPAYQAMLRAALAQEIGGLGPTGGAADPPAVAERAHRIGGLAAYAGREDLRGAAIEVELAARAGDLRGMRDGLDRLRTLASGIGFGD